MTKLVIVESPAKAKTINMCRNHRQRLKDLMQEISPFIIPEHLSWNTLDGFGYNDLYVPKSALKAWVHQHPPNHPRPTQQTLSHSPDLPSFQPSLFLDELPSSSRRALAISAKNHFNYCQIR